jgi:hypothetical protein
MRGLRTVAFIGCVLIFGMWWSYHLTNVRVNDDPTSVPDLTGATAAAQPLLEALEKYHAENGLYPPTLDNLTAPNLPSHGRRHGFLYSARNADWVYKSDTCVAREKQLHGWILKPVKEYQKEIDEFKQDCVTGYRYYQLQSGDFPQDAQTQYMERWAYFDSQTRQWSLGWCTNGKNNQGIGMNGICRWGRHGATAVW